MSDGGLPLFGRYRDERGRDKVPKDNFLRPPSVKVGVKSSRRADPLGTVSVRTPTQILHKFYEKTSPELQKTLKSCD